MKKSILFGAAFIAAISFVSCNKENTVDSPKPLKIAVSSELPLDPQTKVNLVESGSNFTLEWDGDEEVVIANSTNKTYSSAFTVDSHTGTSAVIKGTLPAVTGETTNYLAISNFTSVTDDYVRADLPSTQTYGPVGALANNCILVARADDAPVGTLGSLSFKTMNSFMKFSLKKGSAVLPSTNDYTKMFVQSIKVETIADGEAIAGRFGFNRTGAWGTAYDEVVTAQKQSLITLNCVTASLADGVELDPDTATDFYVAIAFGTYTKGLRITITVKNQSGQFGTYTRTISNGSSYSVDRNTLIEMPALVVNPTDQVVTTYTKVDKIANLAEGDYIMCGIKSGYQAFKGGFSNNTTGGNADTETITYNTGTKTLDYTDAVFVHLTNVGTNQYTISWTLDATTYYLTQPSATKLCRSTTAGDAVVWTASDATGDGAEGIFLSTTTGIIKTATGASSRYIRSYATTNTMTVGLAFFKED